MNSLMRSAAGLVLAAGLLLGACDAGGGSAAPSEPPLDRSSQEVYEAPLDRAVLSDVSAHDWAAEPLGSRGVDVVGYRLLQACRAELATDRRILDERAAGWQGRGGLPVLDQVVLAYDRPVAADAVRQARAALTCKTYDPPLVRLPPVRLGDPLDLGGGADEFGFCEGPAKGAGNHRCVAILGSGHIACAVRVLATDQVTAADRLRSLMPALRNVCR
ncbi:hypothetical protein AB0M46_18605 [Dactylosporangium sp. NPDC051485]|uniref:hypothetical protein n=1 Tax=Dactylosporangium sp. NPDC051485 TaxID=3154846 RepID=UPI00341D4333